MNRMSIILRGRIDIIATRCNKSKSSNYNISHSSLYIFLLLLVLISLALRSFVGFFLLGSLFKECPHPDEKQRMKLSRRHSLETRQVKFWFQNRRTQMKTQLERHENSILRQENDMLQAKNMYIRDAMRNSSCSNCGGLVMLGGVSLEEHHLRIENARLKDELHRVCTLAKKILGRSVSGPSISPSMPNSSLELAVGSNGFAGLSLGSTVLTPGTNFGGVLTCTLRVFPCSIRSKQAEFVNEAT